MQMPFHRGNSGTQIMSNPGNQMTGYFIMFRVIHKQNQTDPSVTNIEASKSGQWKHRDLVWFTATVTDPAKQTLYYPHL